MSENKPATQTSAEIIDASLVHDIERKLDEARDHLAGELAKDEKIKADPEKALEAQKKLVAEALQKAKNYYKKSDYQKAFIEWEKICSFLPENDRFRSKIRDLKASHENLIKANQELVQIKQVLAERSVPPAADNKFVTGAHQELNAQVKGVYAIMSKELRAERIPKTLSFWWPVAVALIISAASIAGLWAYQRSAVRSRPVITQKETGISDVEMDTTYLEAQKNAFVKQIDALNQDHERQLEDLKRKHAEASKNDREKVIQLETKIREAEAANAELERRAQALFEDNVNKERSLSNLQ